jgi:hypothetical protein
MMVPMTEGTGRAPLLDAGHAAFIQGGVSVVIAPPMVIR